MAQGIDQSIECLVRDRFPFVAPAHQDHRTFTLDQVIQESLGERGLARSRASLNEDGHRPALLHGRERGLQGLEVTLASDQPRSALLL